MTVERYRHMVGRLQTDDLDLEGGFDDHPLDAATLRCLRYMHDVEFHTTCYMRDLLVTSAHRDPEVTEFLTFWLYEEYWHGEAISQVLAAHGEVAGSRRVGDLRATRRRRDTVQPMAHWFGSLVAGQALGALQMTWGAINEWTTQAGYVQLARRCGHDMLAELLRRIAKQEGRHIDFYASRATRLLEASASARRLTRSALRRWWRPVGSDVMPEPEVRHLISHLFSGDDGHDALSRIDRHIDAMPGLEGLQLVSSRAAWAGAR